MSCPYRGWGEEFEPAMGFSITELQKKLEKDDKVLVTVITDGEENSSREYDGKAISFASTGVGTSSMFARVGTITCLDHE